MFGASFCCRYECRSKFLITYLCRSVVDLLVMLSAAAEDQRIRSVPTTDLIIHTPVGLLTDVAPRGKAVEGPDGRISPCKTSALERFVKSAGDLDGTETFAPTARMTFDSRQEAYELYNLYSWKQGFGVRHGRRRINMLGYRSMHEIVCQCQGKPGKENTASCCTDCPAKIRLHRTEDHGWYIDPLARDFVKNLRANSVSIGKIYNILGSSGSGRLVPFWKQALRSLCSSISQETMKDDLLKTVKLLQEMRSHDPNMILVVDIDEQGRIKTMLWCTGKNRADHNDFGDAITFDTTYKTNLYNMPFGLFVGVNNHFQSVIFAGQINLVLLIEYQCQAMRTAIMTAMPNSRHRWCKWHVLKSAKEKLGHVYSKHSGFKKEFHELVNAVMSPDEFEIGWEQIVDRYDLRNNPYIDRLYENRAMWAKPYFLDVFCAGMTSTQRSESANSMLKQYISRSSPMHMFVQQYNNLLSSGRIDEGREEHATWHKRRVCTSTTPLEANAAQIYTRTMFDKFKEELYRSGSYVALEDGESRKYSISRAPENNENTDANIRSTYTVEVEGAGEFVSCTCGLFAHVSMLCRHAIKVLIRNDFLRVPEKNVLIRWTVHARQSLGSGSVMVQERRADEERGFRNNVLTMVASDMVKETNRHPVFYDIAMRGLCKIREDLEKMKEVVLVRDENVIDTPKRVAAAGRPSTVRPRSRMEYVADVKKKTRQVSSLYKPPSSLTEAEGSLTEIIGSERKLLKRT
ncbi:hypothetical protein BRADI_2g32740v3, partial [Brachypodium distachyon]